MSDAGAVVLAAVTRFVLVILSIALLLALLRLARGPSLTDRVVALDLMAFLAVGLFATNAIATDEPSFLDAALVLALVAFLATVAFARYIVKRSAG